MSENLQRSGVPAARALTLAEWAELPKEEAGEYVDGQLVEDEVVGQLHDLVGAWLLFALQRWLFARGGAAGLSDTRFGVTARRGRKPDLYAYFAGRPRRPADGLVTVPPDIMVEIVSKRAKDRRRDRIDKTLEYAEFGVKYYWIVDPYQRTIEVFELTGSRYAVALAAGEGTVDIPGCDGLTVDLDALWAHVDAQVDEAERT